MPRKDIRFQLVRTDPCGARRTKFRTDHGEVDGPAFMPVGTHGAVKAMTPDQVEATGAQVVLANTFHMSLEDRRELVKRSGGLHDFMAWNKSILTDSGGFQVFSLPDKIVTEECVKFRWEKDGSTTILDPERSMEIQHDLGADIVMAFDECVAHGAKRGYVEQSVARTTRWAKRCREVELAKHQYLFGIVQGGEFEDLRARSVAEITAIPFDGFAIGGVSVGEGFDVMDRVVRFTAPLLPEDLPRYLMGVGLPEDILAAVGHGIDMFDCVIPTRYARGGTLFTRTGKIRVTDKRYRKDRYPIDKGCRCYTCRNFSRLVLRHLHYAQDPLFETLASIHNVHFYEDLMRDIRAAIEAGRYLAFKGEWLARYTEKQGGPDSAAERRERRGGRRVETET